MADVQHARAGRPPVRPGSRWNRGFDEKNIAQVIAGGNSSTTALTGSTEQEQFYPQMTQMFADEEMEELRRI